MSRSYSNVFRKKLASMVVDGHASTIRTAEKYHVPIKTLENWITAYRKDPKYYNLSFVILMKRVSLSFLLGGYCFFFFPPCPILSI